jgi:phage baseplate assembly protein V
VLLICAEGELAAGVALRGISSTAFPPAGNALRELILFEDGAVIAYDPEAHLLEATLPAGGRVNVSAPGGVSITGPVSIDGRLSVSQDIEAEGDVVGSGISLAHHQHGQVKAGTDKSGPPAAS